jgi:hypothetical protein
MTSPSLSDYLNSINQNKKNIIVDDDTEKAYPPFIINKCLSGFLDTVLFANEMNLYPHLDKKMQYDFFINSISPRKRFSPWEKKSSIDYLDAVKEYYGYNTDKALQALRILTKDQLEEIKRLVNKGGKR